LREIQKKVSYLQGLSEGLNVSDESPQGKVISGMLRVLSDISDELVNLHDEFKIFRDYVESIDDDLFELQENLLDEGEEDDTDYIELECLNCGEKLYFESDIMEGEDDDIEIICPSCREIVFVNNDSFDTDNGYNKKDETETENPSPS